MVKEFEFCPVCHKTNWAILPAVNEGESYEQLGCEHLLRFPWYKEADFLNEFLKSERNNPAIRVPQFHALKLDVVPSEVLEANRERLENVLCRNLHELNGWWFGTLDEKENACKELARVLKPICDFYSQRSK